MAARKANGDKAADSPAEQSSGQQAVNPGVSTKTLELRVPKQADRKIFVAKFGANLGIDFKKWKQEPPVMIKDIGLPDAVKAEEGQKGAAGSELGKERREAAKQRRMMRPKKAEDTPWILTDNANKDSAGKGKKYRGIREGGVQDNSAYYIFTTVDKRIEAIPVAEWYSFTPAQRYQTLTEEEAEKAFQERDKILNHYHLMTRRKILGTTEEQGEDEDAPKCGKKEKGGSLKIRDDDDDGPQEMSDSEEEGGAKDTEAIMDKKDGKKKGNKSKGKKKEKKKKQERPADEAHEESDDGDYETREVDYDEVDQSSSSEEELSDKEESTIKGVDEEIEEMFDEDDDAEDKETGEKPDETESAKGDESESDNDEEDIDKIADSVIPVPKNVENGQPSTSAGGSKDGKSSKGSKRKESSDALEPKSKRAKIVAIASAAVKGQSKPASPKPLAANESKLEEEVRRYLQRKPITMLELVKKLRKAGYSNEEIQRLGDIVKRLDPETNKVGSTSYFHLKTK